ncbi:MAG: hypothetical protein JRN11_02255 [Nitrososphaerota archaeon]|nr:hypothetical protein [Nitrososphaerota archaeon]MDG7014210.1 hypothetical protein [Nitrososphaerota archaeon]MDG7025553.1 hypothetical protein [Nitrososphaerota archaeon]
MALEGDWVRERTDSERKSRVDFEWLNEPGNWITLNSYRVLTKSEELDLPAWWEALASGLSSELRLAQAPSPRRRHPGRVLHLLGSDERCQLLYALRDLQSDFLASGSAGFGMH